MRHGPNHRFETNRAVYGISDVVRQIVSARCSQDTTAQLPLLIIFTSLYCSQDINFLQYFIFPENFVKDRIYIYIYIFFFLSSKKQQMVCVQDNKKLYLKSLQLCNLKKKKSVFDTSISFHIYRAKHVACPQPKNQKGLISIKQ